MAIKATLNAFEYQTLNDVLKSEYKLSPDGNYRLDLMGGYITDRDPSGLMNALEMERAEHKQTKSKFDEIARERDEAKKAAELAALQKTGDAEQLKKYFTEQMEAQKRQWEEQQRVAQEALAKQKQAAAEQYRKAKAQELATELFGQSAPAFIPAIMQGLVAKPNEFGLEPVLEVVNEQGTPVLGATLETYKQSFLTNPIYKPMIVASKASGGSANEGTGSVPVGQKADGTAKTFHDYSPGELLRLKRQEPEKFKSLLETK